MIRRFGPAPSPGIAYRRRAGAYAVLIRNGRLLLTFQAAPDPEYQLPGGGIDTGESPIRALHREVFEETGHHIGQPRLIGMYHRFCFMPDYGFHAHKICAVYMARPTLRIGAPSEPGHTARWVTPLSALALLPDPGSRHMLRGAMRMMGA